MGATTAIFSVVNGVLLRPLPFPHEDRLVTLCEQYPGAPSDWCSVSPPNVEDIAARSRSIEAIGIGRGWGAHMTTPDGAQPVQSGIASPGLFAALGVGVVRGRLITAADLLGRESDVALLTWEMWQAKFSGDTGVVGRIISLDNHPVRIVGILQPGFHVPQFENIELWRPLHVDPRDEQYRDWRGFVAYGRLKPGVSLAQARAELASIAGTHPARALRHDARLGPVGAVAARPRRRQRPPAPRALPRRRRGGAADRVRERGQPAARARRGARPRDGGALGARRQPRPHRALAPRREPRARRRRRGRGYRDRVRRGERVPRARARRHAARRGRRASTRACSRSPRHSPCSPR